MKKDECVIVILILFIISFFLLMSSFVSAAESSLYSGNVKPGTLVIQGQNASLTFGSGAAKLKYLGLIIYTKEGQCQSDSGIKFCVSNISEFGGYVSISAVVASLTVDKKITVRNYSIGELIPVTVLVSNHGQTSANEVNMVDDVSGFDVINPIGCEFFNNSVIFTNSISAGASASCSYSLRAVNDGTYTKAVQVNYFDGVKSNAISDSVQIVINPFGFVINSSLESVKLNITNDNIIFFNFSSKSARDTVVKSLVIEFPDNLKVYSDNQLLPGNKFEWAGNVLNTKKSILFNFNISVLSAENKSAYVTLQFVSDTSGFQNKEIPIKINYLAPEISFKNLNFTKLENNGTFYIKNLNNFDIKNAKVKLSSSKMILSKNEFDVGEVKAGQEIKAGEFGFSAPNGASVLFADLSFNINEEKGIKFSKSINFNIKSNETGVVKTIPPNVPEKTIAENQSKEVKVNLTEKNVPQVSAPKIGFVCRYFGWLIRSLC